MTNPDDETPSPGDLAKTEFERILSRTAGTEHYKLTLFVTGTTVKSAMAVATVRGLLEKHLPGRYELEVVDIYQSPERLKGDQIVAAPTLLKREPFPVQKLVGNLHDADRVLIGLNLKPTEPVNWMEL